MKHFLCGWLDRQGNFHACDEMEHWDLARELEEKLELKYTDPVTHETFHNEGLLEILGWVKFTQSKYYAQFDSYPDKGWVFFFSSKVALTEEQRSWIEKNMDLMSPKQGEEISKHLLGKW